MFFGSKYFQKKKWRFFDFYFYYFKKPKIKGLFENEITTQHWFKLMLGGYLLFEILVGFG
jgi:hypothetical protein